MAKPFRAIYRMLREIIEEDEGYPPDAAIEDILVPLSPAETREALEFVSHEKSRIRDECAKKEQKNVYLPPEYEEVKKATTVPFAGRRRMRLQKGILRRYSEQQRQRRGVH